MPLPLGRSHAAAAGQDSRWSLLSGMFCYGFRVADRFLRHDAMASHMRASYRPFIDLHKPAVVEMQRNLIDYVKALREATAGALDDPCDIPQLTFTQEGHPVIPEIPDKSKLRKGHWEKMLRTFLSHHYSEYPTQKSGHFFHSFSYSLFRTCVWS